MRTEIEYSPSFAIARVHLDQGETLNADAGAMLSMTPTVEIETSTQGGFMKGLTRSLGGVSFFMNKFSAKGPEAHVVLAPSLPGDVIVWPLTGGTVYVQSGSFLAAPGTIDVDSKWGGSKTFFSREGLIMLKCTGAGELVVASYGAIHGIDLAPGQRYVVDTGHMVGWDEGVSYEVRKVGNWKSTMLSGEGLVVELTGPGRIYLQTRSPASFLDWLIPKLPQQQNS